MILYGRNLSPFARRISITCTLQGRAVERRDILTAGPDFERLMMMNPVGRVPVLVLDDGTHLIESAAIADWLDETTPNGVRLVPVSGVARRDCLQRLALASGASEKAVSLVYEKNRRPEEYHWHDWHMRLAMQIRGGLSALEAQVRAWPDQPDAADLMTAILWQFVEVTNPWVLEPGFPNLEGFATGAMALPAFAETVPSA